MIKMFSWVEFDGSNEASRCTEFKAKNFSSLCGTISQKYRKKTQQNYNFFQTVHFLAVTSNYFRNCILKRAVFSLCNQCILNLHAKHSGSSHKDLASTWHDCFLSLYASASAPTPSSMTLSQHPPLVRVHSLSSCNYTDTNINLMRL